MTDLQLDSTTSLSPPSALTKTADKNHIFLLKAAVKPHFPGAQLFVDDSACLSATKTCKVTKTNPENDQRVKKTNKQVQEKKNTNRRLVYLFSSMRSPSCRCFCGRPRPLEASQKNLNCESSPRSTSGCGG